MATRHQRSLYASTALVTLFCAGLGLGLGFGPGFGLEPANAQSVTGTGSGTNLDPAIPAPPLPSWTIPGDLVVGDTGVGTLTIAAGGTVFNTTIGADFGSGILGWASTGNGTVTVTGAGSAWTMGGAFPTSRANSLYIGYSGKGTLNILDGAMVSNATGFVARDPSSTGIATVSGAGSTWTNTDQLQIGIGGTGTLSVTAGGKVSNTAGFLGLDSTATGAATVSGADSAWTNSNSLEIGVFGTGTLTIENGGTVSNTEGYIGSRAAGAAGIVNVSGTGSIWKNSGDLYVGALGTGILTIENGGAVSNVDGVIAHSNTGSVTVSGTDGGGHVSTWTNTGNLYIGYGNVGSLTIENGGLVTSANAVFGFDNTGNGSAMVSGAGSAWTSSGAVFIGNDGAGTLTVANGGKVSATGIDLAENAGGSGTINIGAAPGAAAVAAGTLDVASIAFVNGAGTLNFNHTDSIVLATALSSIGNGTHALNHDAGDTTLTGDSSAFRGVTTVSGGTLNIAQGGKLGGSDGSIGGAVGTNGSVTVTGAGSTWSMSGDLIVAARGTGMLTIEDGGKVVSNGDSIIAYNGGSNGKVTVSGAGSTWNTDRLRVGMASPGTLIVEAGGHVTSNDTTIGFGNPASSAVVTGTGSVWDISGDLNLGIFGTATLTVADGGKVVARNINLTQDRVSAGTVNIGAAPGAPAAAPGTLEVDLLWISDGTGTLNFNHTGVITFAPAIESFGTGTAILNHYAGVTTLTGDSSDFYYGGTTTVSGGTLNIGQGGKLGGIVNVGSGGTLGGGGTIVGATTIDGTLSAGSSPGTLTFAGNLTLNGGSTSAFELSAPGIIGGASNDLVVVTGNLTLGGVLDARVAAAGYYRLFNYGGALSGTFSSGALTGTGGFAPIMPNNPDVQYGIPGQVNLSVLAGGQTMQFWDGPDAVGNGVVDGGAGTWSASGTNWTGRPGEANINGPWSGSVGVFAGAAGGTVTVDGARSFDTLQFSTSGYSLQGGALAIGAAGGGTFNIDSGISATIASTIGDGAGSALRKTGPGTLILTGANSYTGGTTVMAGTLIGNASSIRGDLANAASVILDQASDASFGGDIAGFGGVDGAMTKRGAGELTLAGASTLDWTIEAGGLTTAANRFGGNAAIGAGASLTFDQTSDGVYAAELSGAGSFVKTGGGGALLTGDSSGFAGTTTVDGGALRVGGSSGGGKLGGAIVVAAGGLLGGAGDLGSSGKTVAINAGGVHAPGASQSVLGDYVNRGTLRIEATPAAANKITVAGGVDIAGATLDLVLSPAGAASWAVFNGPYTIIDNQGPDAVVGAFGAVTRNLLFLDPRLAYDGGDGNDVTLALDRNDLAFASVGRTPNQNAIGAAVDALGSASPIWRSIALTSDPATARNSFDALSGEIHASARTALIEDSRFLRNAINDRIRAAFATPGASHAPVLAYASGDMPMAVAPDHAGAVFWSHGFGSWGSIDSDGNAAALDRSTAGLLIGTDGAVGDWRVGLMAGYSHSRFNAPDRASSGDSDNYHFGAYGGTEWGNLSFRSGFAYTWHQLDTRRAVVIPGFRGNPTARYNASTTQVFGEFGYGIVAAGVRFEPFANLAYVHLDGGGFTEQGSAAALAGRSDAAGVTFTTAGLRAATSLALGNTATTLRGMLGWRHAFGDTIPTVTQAFAGSGAFAIAGAPIARDSAVVEAGLDLNLSASVTLGLAYTGQFASGTRDHGFKANLAVKF